MGASFQHEVGKNRMEFEGSVMVPWNRRRSGDRSEAIFRELVEDCEAFLAGRLVEFLERRKALVPAWAWTNLLAHGSVEQLSTVSLEEHFRGGTNTGNGGGAVLIWRPRHWPAPDPSVLCWLYRKPSSRWS
jgi:hypothetical protein